MSEFENSLKVPGPAETSVLHGAPLRFAINLKSNAGNPKPAVSRSEHERNKTTKHKHPLHLGSQSAPEIGATYRNHGNRRADARTGRGWRNGPFSARSEGRGLRPRVMAERYDSFARLFEAALGDVGFCGTGG